MESFSTSVEGECEEFHKELHRAFEMRTEMFRVSRKPRRYWSLTLVRSKIILSKISKILCKVSHK